MLNTYTHAVPDAQRIAVERVAGVLFSDVLSSAAEEIPNRPVIDGGPTVVWCAA